MARYCLMAMLSGLAWSAIALVLGDSAFGRFVWAGVVASPAIGLICALAFLPFRRTPVLGRAMVSLASLYLATGLFGLAIGVCSFVARPGVNAEAVSDPIVGAVWGVTVSGIVLLLWPLAFGNHALLVTCLRRPWATTATASVPGPADPRDDES